MYKESLKRDFILLNVGYAHHNADWNWKDIKSPFVRIHYVKSGVAKIVREDGVYEIKKDHLYLTPSHVKHSYECEGELELFYIHIYEELVKELSIFDLIEFPVEVAASSFDIDLIERLMEINPERGLQYYDPTAYDNSATVAYTVGLQQKSHLACEMETNGIVTQLLSRFLTNANFKNEHIEGRIFKSLRYIHKNIDKTIDIEQLSELCFLTKDHFIRLFKREMNCTPVKYINQKKIEAAQLQILINDVNIKDIAYGLGFENISYFNRLFKKIVGQSPVNYKRSADSLGK